MPAACGQRHIFAQTPDMVIGLSRTRGVWLDLSTQVQFLTATGYFMACCSD